MDRPKQWKASELPMFPPPTRHQCHFMELSARRCSRLGNESSSFQVEKKLNSTQYLNPCIKARSWHSAQSKAFKAPIHTRCSNFDTSRKGYIFKNRYDAHWSILPQILNKITYHLGLSLSYRKTNVPSAPWPSTSFGLKEIFPIVTKLVAAPGSERR